MKRLLSISLICFGAVALIGFHTAPVGWLLILAGLTTTLLLPNPDRQRLLVVLASVCLLAITPVNAHLEDHRKLLMALGTLTAAAMPYVILKFGLHDDAVKFNFHHGRRWYRHEINYVLGTALLAYLAIPFYFAHTHAFLNWHYTDTPWGLTVLFAALIAVGIWDELIFVASYLGVFRSLVPFWPANLLQATVFASFLYELGFRNWGVIAAYAFAVLQGYIFKRTNSLLYAITVHLTLDIMLFFALVHAYHPHQFAFFITG